MPLPSRNHAVVLVSKIHAPDAAGPGLREGHPAPRPHRADRAVNEEDSAELQRAWDAARHRRAADHRGFALPRDHPAGPGLHRHIRPSSPRDVITVFIPEYVVGHWWEQLLHNQSALRLKRRLLYEPGVMVTSVPYQLRSSQNQVNAEV